MAASASKQPSGALRPGAFGPTVAGGKPRNGGPDWVRVGVLAVTMVTVFALLMGSAYAALIFLELRQVEENSVDIVQGPEGGFTPATEGEVALEVPEVDPVTDRTTILLVGSESREGLTDEQLAAIGTEDLGGDLTDTIILLQIDPATDTAAMLSFPRDLVVTWCDGGRGRINRAFSQGELQGEGLGPKCLVDTITAMTRIEIDHYVRVNFAGFIEAVDALGGVEFYVDEPLEDAYSGISIPEPGCVAFDGVKALQFVRTRRVDNDFGRIARQQRFAREMVNKATSLGTLTNPVSVARLIGSISEVLETDQNFGVSQMVDLVTSVQQLTAGGIDGRTVPAVDGRLGEADVVYAIEDEAEALYLAFRQGLLLPDDVGTAGEPQALSPTNVVPIEVLNGAGTDGLATAAAGVLEDLGFTVSETGEAANYGFESSMVLYPPDRQDHAELLAEALGGVAVEPGNAETEDLVLILGEGFDPDAVVAPTGAGGGASEGAVAGDDVVAGEGDDVLSAAEDAASEADASESPGVDGASEVPSADEATEDGATEDEATEDEATEDEATEDGATEDGSDGDASEGPTEEASEDAFAGASQSDVQC